jgi:hypothetical protein
MRTPKHQLIALVVSLFAIGQNPAWAADVSKQCAAAKASCQKSGDSCSQDKGCAHSKTAHAEKVGENSLLAPCAMQKALASFCATCESEVELADCCEEASDGGVCCADEKCTQACGSDLECCSQSKEKCTACNHDCQSHAAVAASPLSLFTFCGQMARNLLMAGTVWAMNSDEVMEIELAWNDEPATEDIEVLALKNVDVYMIREGDQVRFELDAASDHPLDKPIREAIAALEGPLGGVTDLVAITSADGQVATVARVYALNVPQAPCAEPAKLQVAVEDCQACPALARAQNLYGDLCEQGCDMEAEELIDQILAQKLSETSSGITEAHYQWKDANSGPKHHQVGYQPTPFDGRAPLGYKTAEEWEDLTVRRQQMVPSAAKEWSIASQGMVSFHFQGAPLEEVANYFHHATGMNVAIDTQRPAGYYTPAGIHVLCRDKSVEQSLRVVLGSCGLGYAVVDGVIVIGDAARIEAFRGECLDCWIP